MSASDSDSRLWAGDRSPADPASGAAPAPRDGDPPPPAGPRPRRGRRAAVAGGVVVAAIAAGALGAGMLRDEPAGTTTAASTPPASAVRVAGGSVASVYAKASPAVVSIRAGQGQGTGFLIDRDGTVVTNAHVVGDASTVQVRFGEDGRRATGRVVGSDPSSDLAVVRIDAGAASGVTPLRFAADRTVSVGDAVVAIGNPFGLDRTATAGIVSAKGRSIEAPDGFSISGAIQTDAPINPGNSGGPLLDGAGRVIGVTSQIATSGAGGGNVGVGFAVPSSLVREVVPALQSGRSIARPYLGVSTGETPGGAVVVGAVAPGGPAARAGMRAGDELLAVDGEAVDAPEDVSAAIADDRPGDEVGLEVRRDGGRQTLQVSLGTRPDQGP